MELTAENRRIRKTGIGASEAAGICNLSPRSTPLTTYWVKIGEMPEEQDTEPMYWGRAFEDDLIMRYAAMGHPEVCVISNSETFRAPGFEWMLATPDAFCTTWGPAAKRLYGLECKTAAAAKQVARFGKGGDQLPEEYIVQAQWSMDVLNLDRWDFAVLLATYHGFEYREYTLTARPALQARLREIGRQFWYENVLARKEPSPTGLAVDEAVLRALHPQPRAPLAPASEEVVDWAETLTAVEEEVLDASRRRDALRQNIMAAIGDSEGVETTDFRITWKADKRGRRIFRATGDMFDRTGYEGRHLAPDRDDQPSEIG